MILHFGDWHGEPPLVSQVYSKRVLAYRVPLLLRGKLGRTAGIELYIFGISEGVKSADGGRSGFGTSRTWRDVRVESVMRSKADIVGGASSVPRQLAAALMRISAR